MSSLSPALQSVVQLFRGPLAGVRFATIDAAGLDALATEVESASDELQAQEAKLTELKQSLAQRQEALLVLAQQALAYARIYAEGDDALSAELNQIALPRAAKPRKKDATAKPAAEEAEAAVAEAAPLEAPPESSEVVVEAVTEPEAVTDDSRLAAVIRRARGRAKSGTART